MTRRRWIADEVSGDRALLLGKNAYHLARVLRAKPGQQFDVVAAGHVRRGTVADVSDERVVFDLAEEVSAADLLIEVSLLLAVFKFERMEWAIEKVTELGVARIVPVIARRSEKHLAAAAPKRVERWRRIVEEAAQQSRRASVPEIAAPLKLDAVLADADRGIVLAESEQEISLKQVLSDMKPANALWLAIGPEGGWTNEEVESFRRVGWRSATLGKTILRTETAAIAALAITLAELD